MKAKWFFIFFGVFVNSPTHSNIDTNLSDQTACPEFGLVQFIQEDFPVQYKA